jgi:hypothetical protein
MQKSTYIFFLTLSCCFALSYAQSGKAKKAKTDYDSYAYKSAITTYEDMVKKGYSGQEIFQNLGNANYVNANYEEAANWYGQLFDLDTHKVLKALKSMKNPINGWNNTLKNQSLALGLPNSPITEITLMP